MLHLSKKKNVSINTQSFMDFSFSGCKEGGFEVYTLYIRTIFGSITFTLNICMVLYPYQTCARAAKTYSMK